MMLVSLVCALAAPAMAVPTIGDSVQVAYLSTGPGVQVNVVTPVFSGNLLAGIQNITVDGAPIKAFCIEYDQLSRSAGEPYLVTEMEDAPVPGPAMGEADAMSIMKVWSWWDSSSQTAMQAAVAQCTIWEVLDNGDFLTGNFQLNTATVRTQAESLLAALPGMTNYTYMLALTNRTYQDYGFPVPVPGAMLLGSLGVGLVGWMRKRHAL